MIKIATYIKLKIDKSDRNIKENYKMKNFFITLVLILALVMLNSCQGYVRSYSATILITSCIGDEASMEFGTFKGTYNFRLKGNNASDHTLDLEASLAEGEMNIYIGVGGVLTFKNAVRLKQVVSEVPLEHILLETDAPYMAPEPFRGKTNQSMYISYVAEAIAARRGMDGQTLVDICRENARRLFGV